MRNIITIVSILFLSTYLQAAEFIPKKLSQMTDDIGFGTHMADTSNPHGTTTTQTNLTVTNLTVTDTSNFGTATIPGVVKQTNGTASNTTLTDVSIESGTGTLTNLQANGTITTTNIHSTGVLFIDAVSLIQFKNNNNVRAHLNNTGLAVGGDFPPSYPLDVLGTGALTGNLIQSTANSYHYFGGASYGIRDNGGTMQFMNSGGSWANMASSTSGGGWQDDGSIVRPITVADQIVIGSTTANGTNILTVVGHEKVTGTVTASGFIGDATGLTNVPAASGTLTIQAIIATSTVSIGTTTINTDILTIYGSATNLLTVKYNNTLTGTNTTSTMTGTNTPSGIVTASTVTPGYEAYEAFDKVLAEPNRWVSATATGWITYDFGTGTTKAVGKYRMTTEGATFSPQAFTLQVGTDNVNWKGIDSRISQTWSKYVYNDYTIATSTTPYQFYRLLITENTSGASAANVHIDEIQLIEYIDIANVPAMAMQILGTGTVLIGTSTPNGTQTAYALQINGSGLATSWGVTCYKSIKSVIDKGTETINRGFDAVMGTKLATHHPKIMEVDIRQAEEIAKRDYVDNFTETDFETFKTDNLERYTVYDGEGSSTVNWQKFKEDFQSTYVDPRKDEFYVLSDVNNRIETKKIELESDTSITNISPISDDPSTPDIFKRYDPRILDLGNMIGSLIGAVKHQQAEIEDLKTKLENK